MTITQLIGIDGVCLMLVALVVYFTRATLVRVLGAAIGGLVAVVGGIGFDAVGNAMGWWHYTMGTAAHGPPLMYLAIWLWYGVGVTLIGWRVSRRFGRRGLIGFIGFMSVYGPLRDYIGVALTRGTVQVISTGIAPLVGDVVLWASLNAVAQGIMWLISGSPESDPLLNRLWQRHASSRRQPAP